MQQGRDMNSEDAEDLLLAHLLPFHRRMVEELISEDGLCILSAGMGWQKVVAVLLRLQMERMRNPDEHGALLILGAMEWQRHMINKELVRIDPALAIRAEAEDDALLGGAAQSNLAEVHAPELPTNVTNETPALGRTELYRSKACLFVTTRILVVDMLTRRIAGNQIAGIILMNAHRVSDTSQDGFAVRLFRTSNKDGFLRAFSDQPLSFTAGFAKLEKVMKALFLRRLYLWPRFEATAKEVLDAIEKDIEVIELEVAMTASMSEIYLAISELMDACIKELRKSNTIDSSELTLESGLFQSFDDIVRRQLDSIWHTVSPKTKQIVSDLKTLRTLAEYLFSFDAVTFLAYLDNLRITEGVSSVWLFHNAAHTIFEQAKRRVYHVQHNAGPVASPKKASSSKRQQGVDLDGEPLQAGGSATAASPIVHAVLEPLPKWRLVLDIMQEIQQERIRLASEASTSGRSDDAQDPRAVLIVAQEARTCLQLKVVLRDGGDKGLQQKLYSEFLLQRLEVKRDARRAAGSRGGRFRRSGRGGRQSGTRLEQLRAQRMQGDPTEQEALLSVAQAIADAQDTSSRGRGRGRGGKRASKKAKGAESPPPAGVADREEAEEGKEKAAKEQESSPLLDEVYFVSLESREAGVLWEVKPVFVVMYDPDVAFVRQLEVYKAERPGSQLRVYNLWYSNSLESDRYAASLVREQRVFEELISQKAYMVLPDLVQDLTALVPSEPPTRPSAMHPDVVLGIADATHEAVKSNALTRRGGVRAHDKPLPRRLAVDVREFMSSLPAVLYQQGLDIVPLTLEVGDYILSPEMCVERKSLSDLRGSFISGRLYHQAEAMTRHYKIPILLIEFERDKAFVLHGPTDIGGDINANSLISKLTLLTLHFPRLRLIWSRSLHASADLFRALKSNQDDPDPLVAASIGVPDVAEGSAGAEALVNTAAVDVLRRLPGVGEANYRPLMTAAGSLAGLAAMSLQDLERVMGGTLAAKKLRDWLDATCPRL